MHTHIEEWIERISIPNQELGGFSVCPYSKKSKYQIIYKVDEDINPHSSDADVIVYIMPEFYSLENLNKLAKKYNQEYPQLVFLPDHKDRQTFINGVQTNNGKYNLILCQRRDKLNESRNKLAATNYYKYWDKDYLEEILNS